MSEPILPLAVWQSGTNENSVPANDNSLRSEILLGRVIADDVTAQPGAPDDGDIYIIPAGATGAQWELFDEFDLAIYVSAARFSEGASGGTWHAYAPIVGVIVNLAGQQAQFTGTGYEANGGLPDAPSDGTVYGRKDGAWEPVSSGSAAPLVTESGTNLNATASNAGNYTRFTDSGAKTYTFDDAEGFMVGAEYHGRNAGAGSLEIAAAGAMTINAPPGGTLFIPEGGTFTVKIVASDEADLFGATEAA